MKENCHPSITKKENKKTARGDNTAGIQGEEPPAAAYVCSRKSSKEQFYPQLTPSQQHAGKTHKQKKIPVRHNMHTQERKKSPRTRCS